MSMDIKSVVTGTVYQLEVATGDQVKSGDDLVILESMKMEIPVMVDTDGTIKELLVGEGDEVTEDQEIAVLET